MGDRWGGVASFTPQHLCYQERPLVSTEQDAGVGPSVCQDIDEKSLLPLPGFEHRSVHPVAQ